LPQLPNLRLLLLHLFPLLLQLPLERSHPVADVRRSTVTLPGGALRLGCRLAEHPTGDQQYRYQYQCRIVMGIVSHFALAHFGLKMTQRVRADRAHANGDTGEKASTQQSSSAGCEVGLEIGRA
jgi:hypothetical protein